MDWQFSMISSTIVASYHGQYPLLAGASLPEITLSGVLTATAPPIISVSAAVKTLSGGTNVKKEPRKHFAFIPHDASSKIF